MGVYVRTLLIAALVVALVPSALAVSGDALLRAPWAGAAIAIAGLLVGGFITLALFAGSPSRGVATLLHAEPPQVPDPSSHLPSAEPPTMTNTGPRPVVSEDAILGFVEQLMAATTSEGLLATVQTTLPPLIGGRRVWLVSDLRKRHAPDSVDTPSTGQEAPLISEVQEWTTFPLRVNDKSVGLLGVESSGGLGPDRQLAIQRVTPLLARAVTTVRTIETFREAGLVDLLTGAATRREGLNRLNSEVKRAQRLGTSMAVLMVDLDHFKAVNDRYGHAVGDALLTAIGRTLRTTLRASDIRCRWGGEEFLIVLPDADLGRAQVVAGHLLHNIASAFVPTPSGPVTTTASIGLTISRPHESAVNNLVARADLALYRAKREGRSCIRVVLGDHDGRPIGAALDNRVEPASASSPPLPFPDRRSTHRTDRRRVPSSGRRRTDPGAAAEGVVAKPPVATEEHGQALAGFR
jgi:diguanylate cyclase (GGDEF)-like protein